MKEVLKKNKGFLLITCILVFFISLITLIVPLLLQTISKRIQNIMLSDIIALITLLIITYAFQFILIVIRESYSAKYNIYYAKLLYNKMFHMKYDSLIDKEPTYIIERIAIAVNSIYNFISNNLTNIMSSIIIIIISLGIILFISKLIFLFFLLVIPINLLGYKLINKKLQIKSEHMQEVNASNYKTIMSIIKDVDYIKQLGSYDSCQNLIEPCLINIYQTMSSVNKFGQGASLIIQSVNNFVQNITFIYVSIYIINGNLHISSLIIISILLPIYFSAISNLSRVNLNIRDIKASDKFIESEIEEHREVENGNTISQISNIYVKNPIFSLGNEVYEFNIIDEYKKGDVVFVSGPSGVGKSTLLKLLLRFRDSKGIYINGTPINDINPLILRKQISYISQSNIVLPLSLKDNISYGREIDSNDWDTLQDIELLKPVFKNKNLRTQLLENGSNLSGGEKQRLIIARSLFDRSDVLLLDEITSNIDKESSDDIYQYILKGKDEKITFIISHDKSIKEYCNKVIDLSMFR